MTMGLNADLDEATKIATREMLDWIVEMKGSAAKTHMLASAAMDLVVTQVVDGTKGVHALLPKAIFKNQCLMCGRRRPLPARRPARERAAVRASGPGAARSTRT